DFHVTGVQTCALPIYEADLEQERLVGILHRLRLFSDGDGQGPQPHRAAPELEDDRFDDGPVDLVQAEFVDLEDHERPGGGRGVDMALGAGNGVVADPRQEPVGDAGGGTAPASDLEGGGVFDVDAQDSRRTGHDRGQFRSGVVVQLLLDPEPVPQRGGDGALAGGGSDQGESGQVESDRLGGGAFAEDDVDGEVLHGRIEDLFDGAGEPVDLVDEEDVALFEVRQDGGQVARSLQRRSRGEPQVGPHLGGHDPGQGGLTQPGRTREEDVVEGSSLAAGGIDRDPEPFLDLLLADELVETMRSECDLDFVVHRRAE